MSKITIGCIAKDAASGFQGTVTSRSEFMNGNIQFALQPAVKDDSITLPEAVQFDIAQLDYVSEGISGRSTPANDHCPGALGALVEDKVTGLRGTATHRTTFLNGCVYYIVTRKVDNRDDIPEMFADSSRLTIITPATLPAATAAKPVGGPSTRARRAT